jgi:hypothetical protein
MTHYRIAIDINMTDRPESIHSSAQRMARDWFGSLVQNITVIDLDDPEPEPDIRTCEEQARDDHMEGVARALKWKSYTRTDGTIIYLQDTE